MKSIGINDELHKRIRRISKKTGILIYRLILDSVEYLEDKYEVTPDEEIMWVDWRFNSFTKG